MATSRKKEAAQSAAPQKPQAALDAAAELSGQPPAQSAEVVSELAGSSPQERGRVVGDHPNGKHFVADHPQAQAAPPLPEIPKVPELPTDRLARVKAAGLKPHQVAVPVMGQEGVRPEHVHERLLELAAAYCVELGDVPSQILAEWGDRLDPQLVADVEDIRGAQYAPSGQRPPRVRLSRA